MEITSHAKQIELHPHLTATKEEAERLCNYLNQHYPNLALTEQLRHFSEDLTSDNWPKIVDPYKKISNKIVIGPPVNSVIRKNQERDIIQSLRNRNNVYIRGYWRTGKSTMLESLQDHFPGSNMCTEFNCKTAEEAKRLLADVIGFAIYQAEHPDLINPDRPSTEDKKNWQEKDFEELDQLQQKILRESDDPVEYYNRYLAEKNIIGLLCIDEVRATMDKPEVFNYVASLDRPFSHLRLAFVLHRTRRGEKDLMSRFKSGKTFCIGSITEEDLDTLLDNYNKDHLVEFTLEAKKALIYYAGTAPYAFNHLVSVIFDQIYQTSNFKEHRYDDDKTIVLEKLKLTITEEDVEAAACRLIDEEVIMFDSTGMRNGIKTNSERIIDSALNDHEQEVVYLLSVRTIDLAEVQSSFSPEKQQALQSLVDYGLVAFDDKKFLYQLNGEILRTIIEKAAEEDLESALCRNSHLDSSFRQRVATLLGQNLYSLR